MKYLLRGFSMAFTINGRDSRKEYWMFWLQSVVSIIVISFGGALIFQDEAAMGLLSGLMQLAFLIPSFTAGVRRMHDVGKSGWFLLIPIYSLILLASPSQNQDNKWGAFKGASIVY